MSDTDYTLMIQQNTMLMQQLEEVLHILRQIHQSAVEQDEYQEYIKLSEYYAITDIEKARLYLDLAREVKDAPVVREQPIPYIKLCHRNN